jgi:hypothetical protein
MVVVGAFYIAYVRTVGIHNPIKNRREIQAESSDGKVLSLKESVFQEIYAEALDVTLRQKEVNLRISKGDLSDDVQNEIIRINHDIDRVAEKSVNMGMLKKSATKLTIV